MSENNQRQKITFFLYVLLFGTVSNAVLVLSKAAVSLVSSDTQNNVYGFGEHGIGKFLVMLTVMGLVFLLLLLCLEAVSWNLKNLVFRNIIFYFYNKFRNSREVSS